MDIQSKRTMCTSGSVPCSLLSLHPAPTRFDPLQLALVAFFCHHD